MFTPLFPITPRRSFKVSLSMSLLVCILISQFALSVFPSYAQQGEAEVLLAQATLAYDEGQ